MRKLKTKGKIECKCDFCGVSISKYQSDIHRYNFCDFNCKIKWNVGKSFLSENKRIEFSEKFKGENNPNWNNRWNEAQRKKASAYKKQWYDGYEGIERRNAVSKVHKGKKLSDKQRKAISSSQKGRASTITDESRVKIGIKSKEKFTPEYKKRIRENAEKYGHVISLKDKDDYLFYRECADWVEKMFNYIKNEDQLNKLQKFGVFNPKTNKDGVVRDHMYSRRSGWENGVFPEILRHPANLDILFNIENIKKKVKGNRDSDTISLLDLFKRIKQFDQKWFEQDRCIFLISKYENGDRYNKKDYIDKYYDIIKRKPKIKGVGV